MPERNENAKAFIRQLFGTQAEAETATGAEPEETGNHAGTDRTMREFVAGLFGRRTN